MATITFKRHRYNDRHRRVNITRAALLRHLRNAKGQTLSTEQLAKTFVPHALPRHVAKVESLMNTITRHYAIDSLGAGQWAVPS